LNLSPQGGPRKLKGHLVLRQIYMTSLTCYLFHRPNFKYANISIYVKMDYNLGGICLIQRIKNIDYIMLIAVLFIVSVIVNIYALFKLNDYKYKIG